MEKTIILTESRKITLTEGSLIIKANLIKRVPEDILDSSQISIEYKNNRDLDDENFSFYVGNKQEVIALRDALNLLIEEFDK